ncbi:hypothetical protein KIW84_041887 [Lathyrus oleraceus]|uniref:Ubiquitin-like protease family profile domain-containing protein n=1 Tax=Pisum sativum TaxID=3888 RepID=A0A9D5AM13_PEA|nr:hypothetical protein KIW84_041887 [Pisum sativum]
MAIWNEMDDKEEAEKSKKEANLTLVASTFSDSESEVGFDSDLEDTEDMASNEDHPHGDETVGAKDKIWSEIKRCFDIEENRRDHCLKLAGKKGRVGYGRLEQSILTKENSSETSLPAHVLWKEARVGKDGKIKEDVQQIFEKCETLSQSIVPYEDTDCRSILSRALDVPEYSGRRVLKILVTKIVSIVIFNRLFQRAFHLDALLPHPDDVSDATLLGDAIGSFVAWPTDLIIVGYETPTKSKAKDKGIAREIESVASQKEIPVAKKTEISKRTGAKKKNPSKYRACLHTYLETTDISDGCVRLIPMDGAIFGFEYAEPLGKEDFDQILYHTQLSVGVINTYMRYLYDKLMGPRGLEQRFSFLNPMKTNLTEMIRKPDEVRTYVVERFMADTDREKLFFLPFNTGDGGHWLLVAINPFKEIVYYLDSLHNDWTTYPAMKTIVDTIIQTVRAQRKIQVPKRKANNITWNRVECPRQRNKIDCGYYTLRFMKETLLMDRRDIPSDYFDEYRCAYYSKDQLDEIKEELCQFIIELQVL